MVKSIAHRVIFGYVNASIKLDAFFERTGVNAASKKFGLEVVRRFDPATAEIIERTCGTQEERQVILECTGEIMHAMVDAIGTPVGSDEREGVDAALREYGKALFVAARRGQAVDE